MAMTAMKMGEKARIYCTPKYGYTDRNRPPLVGPKDKLTFEVEFLRFEKVICSRHTLKRSTQTVQHARQEPNLHEMDAAEMFEFIRQ